MDKSGKLSIEALDKIADSALAGQPEGDTQFSQNLVNFLSKPSESAKRQEKVEKAEALGLMDQPAGDQSGMPTDIPSPDQTPPQE